MKKKSSKVALVVTTEKGVFFGYGVPNGDKTIRIENARMCVYWSQDMKGVVGLASMGPSMTCKIGPPAPAITLQNVTAVIEASQEAAAKWELGSWR